MGERLLPDAKEDRLASAVMDNVLSNALVSDLRAQIADLEKDKAELRRDYNHAYKMWRACAGNLRAAREKNRLLMLKLDARSQRGN